MLPVPCYQLPVSQNRKERYSLGDREPETIRHFIVNMTQVHKF